MWSLDVDSAEQQLVVGGVSAQLQLYHIRGGDADSDAGVAGTASRAGKEVCSLLTWSHGGVTADRASTAWLPACSASMQART